MHVIKDYVLPTMSPTNDTTKGYKVDYNTYGTDYGAINKWRHSCKVVETQTKSDGIFIVTPNIYPTKNKHITAI